jgi:hypothetical protein
MGLLEHLVAGFQRGVQFLPAVDGGPELPELPLEAAAGSFVLAFPRGRRLQERAACSAELPGGVCDLVVRAHGHCGEGCEEPGCLRYDHAQVIDSCCAGIRLRVQDHVGAGPEQRPLDVAFKESFLGIDVRQVTHQGEDEQQPGPAEGAGPVSAPDAVYCE